LQERIRQKTISFEKRSKDIKEKLARMSELEEELFRRKKRKSESEQQSSSKAIKKSNSTESDEEDERPRFNSSKDGEEKYEQIIYSISASSGKFFSVHMCMDSLLCSDF
jgi:hypothetical protein